ncbi:bifunctional protein aas, partial [Trifolium medium]|nr:bifunctional protein aas [Trifolium medium]
MTFIKKPLLWLEIISKYQATHSAGPNFAFELLIRRLEADKDRIQNLDLSSLVFLMVAAEPVRQKTLKRFIELTTPLGLSQKGRVCCGYVRPEDTDIDIRIVDPDTCEELHV